MNPVRSPFDHPPEGRGYFHFSFQPIKLHTLGPDWAPLVTGKDLTVLVNFSVLSQHCTATYCSNLRTAFFFFCAKIPG